MRRRICRTWLLGIYGKTAIQTWADDLSLKDAFLHMSAVKVCRNNAILGLVQQTSAALGQARGHLNALSYILLPAFLILTHLRRTLICSSYSPMSTHATDGPTDYSITRAFGPYIANVRYFDVQRLSDVQRLIDISLVVIQMYFQKQCKQIYVSLLMDQVFPSRRPDASLSIMSTARPVHGPFRIEKVVSLPEITIHMTLKTD